MRVIPNDLLAGMIKKHELWLEKKKGGEQLKLKNVVIYDTEIESCNLKDSEFVDCLFNKVHMKLVKFSSSNLIGCTFRDSHIELCDFKDAQLCRSTFNKTKVISFFRNVDMFRSYIVDSDFSNVDFNHGFLQAIVVENSIFNSCCFANVDISQSKFEKTDLSKSNFYKANMENANMVSSKIDECNFEKACLSYAILPERVVQVGPIGSRRDYTIYWIDKDLVLCGCWNEHKGGTLKEFEERVHETYKAKYDPFRLQYEAAIAMFKLLRDVEE